MAELAPVHVAEALAELAAPRVLEAAKYLREWHGLERARVPARLIRHVLLERHEQTAALGHTERWAHSRPTGVFGLAGPTGTGKGYAGSWWLLSLLRAWSFGQWLSCAELAVLGWGDIEARLVSALAAPALVVDDLGAGEKRTRSGEDLLRPKLSALLLARTDASRPTLVLSNGTKDELSAWLGDRQRDRQRHDGGVADVAGPSLRRPDSDELDEHGRGRAWRLARALVDTFGVDGDEVGGRLIADAQRARSFVAVYAAADLVGVDHQRVEALGAERAANDRTDEMADAYIRARDRLAGQMTADLANERRLATERAAKETAELLDRMRRRARSEPEPREPVAISAKYEGVPGRKLLEADGYRVRKTGAKWRAEFGAYVLAIEIDTAAEAWDVIRREASQAW